MREEIRAQALTHNLNDLVRLYDTKVMAKIMLLSQEKI